MIAEISGFIFSRYWKKMCVCFRQSGKTIILSGGFGFFFFACGDTDSNKGKAAIEYTQVQIDTLKTQAIERKELYFTEAESQFPVLTGMKDSVFQGKVNKLIVQNYRTFADSALARFGLKEEQDRQMAGIKEESPASCKASFSILTHSENMISIVQFFTSFVGHGGNSWTPAFAVINIDLKQNKIMGSSPETFTNETFESINKKVVSYFRKNISENYQGEGLEKGGKICLAMRNDSIVLVTNAYPGSHDTYGTYLIPIGKRKI
jgi:hypothetical protein